MKYNTNLNLAFGIFYLHSFLILQKENSKNKESKSPGKKANKRHIAKKETKSNKRTKTEWDSQNADSAAEYEVVISVL